jgi:endonuclease/exonuclease/phosphatase family metal-dependent hydrolase
VAQLRAGSLWLASSHLGLRPRERLEHSSELLSVLEKLEPHRVLVGADLNALPGRDAHSALVAGGLVDLWERAGEGSGATFPSKTPRARIDVLLARGSFAVGRIDVVSSSASDHLPVVADLVWGDL